MVIDVATPLTTAGVVGALLALATGFVGHEALHIGTLRAFGRPVSIDFDLDGLVFAASPPPGTPRWQNALTLLAPVPFAVAGLAWMGVRFGLPLSLDQALIAAGFAIGALPSPADGYVLLMYDPDAAPREVAADG